VRETNSGESKSDESAWMRLTLDTVGKLDWPRDSQGRPLHPEGFEELAKKLGRPLHPPGRDVRCIVSVGMLTEGWDCNTVTHIVGLRPFMSQLLCEQVVGRGLRRSSYEVDDNDRLAEEVAKVFGVPFEVVPFKATQGTKPERPAQHHVHAIPEKARYEIRFPRVEGYQQAIRNRVTIDRAAVAPLVLDPGQIPPELEAKAGLVNNRGRPSLTGPGRLVRIDLNPYRAGRRNQELAFELARDLTRAYIEQPSCQVPAHVLFPQIVEIVAWYLRERVRPLPPADVLDVFLSPYYGWVIERLAEAIRPDAALGEAPEIPRYETSRGPGSTGEVEYWTRRDVREVIKSHVNFVVADTQKWEQSAAYVLDTHPFVEAFVKNAGLGFAIPYLNNGEMHEYVPDFIVRLATTPHQHLILETKGFDPIEDVKRSAAERWVAAVNAEGSFGTWAFALIKKPTETRTILDKYAK
jgi:type III restriction enzyme